MAGFKDFLLKPELLRAIQEAGFEKPSEVQNSSINKAINGRDILCQAQAGTGKTAVFVISVLNQLREDSKEASCVVMAPVRELATQIRDEFKRFSKFLPFKAEAYYGGIDLGKNIDSLKTQRPHIIVGTPGRLVELVRKGHLRLNNVKFFIIDECDRMLNEQRMREQVQEVFLKTPKDKQTMMFSGTISPEVRTICVKYMDNPVEIIVEDQSQLVLHGMDQYKKEILEASKISELRKLLERLDYSQAIVFVSKADRSDVLAKELSKGGEKFLSMHSRLNQDQRNQVCEEFRKTTCRVLVSTDIFERGMDFPKVNLVVSFDTPKDRASYLHRVGRAGRMQTKGVSITFVASEEEKKMLEQVQNDLKFKIKDLPETLIEH